MHFYFAMANTYASSTQGVTLIEVLTTLAVLSILISFGLPQFREIHERWQVMQTVRSMESSLLLARSEAIKRGGGIGIRKLDNEKNGCQNAATTSEWGCGWLVYADADGNGSWNKQKDVLLQEIKLSGSVNVMRSSNGNNLSFNRYGMASLNAIGFTFLPARTGVSTHTEQMLCMSSGGRIRIIKDISCK